MKRIYRAIYSNTFNPSDFANEVGPGCCVFHDSNKHTTADCTKIKKAIEKAGNLRSGGSQKDQVSDTSNNQTPVAKTVGIRAGGAPQQHLSQIDSVDLLDLQGNNDFVYNLHNDDVMNYLSISSKHISLNSSLTNPTVLKHKLVLDSGAFPHMSNDKNAFVTFLNWPPTARARHVMLADKDCTAPIEGFGTIAISINGFNIRLHNVLYVPALSTSLFSVKEHENSHPK